MRLWHWLMNNMSAVYVYGSLVLCLLLLAAVVAGLSSSPRWAMFR